MNNVEPILTGPESLWRRVVEQDGPTAVVLVGIINLGLILLTSHFTLQHFPNSADEYAYTVSADLFSEGKLHVISPEPREFFSFTHVLNDGHFYGKYPPGWPLLLSPGIYAGVSWLINPVLGVLTLLLIHKLAREQFSVAAANIAVYGSLLNPWFIFNAASYFSHVSCLFFLTLSAYCYFRCLTDPEETASYVISGLSAGMAFLIRPFTSITMLLPLLCYWPFYVAKTRKLTPWLPRITGFLISLGIFATIFLFYNYAQTGDCLLQPFSKYDSNDRPGPTPTSNDLAWALDHNLLRRLWDLNIWLPFSTILPLAFLWNDRNPLGRTGLLLLSSALCTFIAYFFYWFDAWNQYGPRYMYETSVALQILSGSVLARWNKWGQWCLLLIITVNLAMLLSNTRFFARQVAERTEVYSAVKKQGIENAIVFIATGSGTMPIGDLTRNGIHFDGSVLYVWDLGARNFELKTRYPGRKGYLYTYDNTLSVGHLRPYLPWNGER